MTATDLSIISAHAAQAEKDKRLTSEQLEVLHRTQAFKALVPKAYGGLELPLPEVVRLEESIARADGSTGWVMTLCAGAGWFGGFMDPTFAKQIFADDKACLAGSGASTGTAEINVDGYLVNGRWQYASGAPDATVFTANCIITKNGVPVKNSDGTKQILAFAFLREEVRLLPEWNSVGMIATASYNYAVKDLPVSKERSFKIDGKSAVIKAPLYYYPFLQLAEATLAANILGLGLHFIELAGKVLNQKIETKELPDINADIFRAAIDEVSKQLEVSRNELYRALDTSWAQSETSGVVDKDLLAAVSKTSRAVAKTAVQGVDRLYPYCGLRSANLSTDINRVWRDLHTASQHGLLVFER